MSIKRICVNDFCEWWWIRNRMQGRPISDEKIITTSATTSFDNIITFHFTVWQLVHIEMKSYSFIDSIWIEGEYLTVSVFQMYNFPSRIYHRHFVQNNFLYCELYLLFKLFLNTNNKHKTFASASSSTFIVRSINN